MNVNVSYLYSFKHSAPLERENKRKILDFLFRRSKKNCLSFKYGPMVCNMVLFRRGTPRILYISLFDVVSKIQSIWFLIRLEVPAFILPLGLPIIGKKTSICLV